MPHSDLSYVWEKLFVAVLGMARSSESPQDRIYGAYMSFHTLRVDDFPGELRDTFAQIYERITREEAQGSEGTVLATLRKMDEQDASQVIEQIVGLYDAIARLNP